MATEADLKKSDDFYTRAANSQGEARKLLTGIAAAGFGVFYTTLTKPLVAGNKWLLFSAMGTMGLAVIWGIVLWRLEAKWAYEMAVFFRLVSEATPEATKLPIAPPKTVSEEAEKKSKASDATDETKKLHDRRNLFDYAQLVLFAFGLFLSLVYTGHFL